MGYVWIFLWVIFAGAVLSFLGWSTNIMMAQKKAWGEFAARYKLDVTKSKRFLGPISITGAIGGRRLNIYAQSEQQERERTERIYSHVEVFLNALPPATALFSKRPLPEFMADFSLGSTFTTPAPGWFAPTVAQTSDAYALANWLNPVRMKAFKNFTDNTPRGAEPIFVCDGDQAFLLWRTEDPLRDPRNLNALVQKLFGIAKELDTGEATGKSAKPNVPSEISEPDISA